MYHHSYFPPGYPMTDGTPNFMMRPFSPLANNENLPHLDQRSFDKLIKTIYDSIVNEATAAQFYTKLKKEAPNTLHKEFIEHVRDDELKHMQAFTHLYVTLVGHVPHIKIESVQYTNYKAGILKALKDKMEAVELYCDVQLLNSNPVVREIFNRAMIDEMEHTTQFGALYNTI